MGVGLVRSLQPPDILWIHWRVYNFIANTNKWVLFLLLSDAYVRSFLYLLYTLRKLYYTKVLSDQASSLALDWVFLLRGPESQCHDTTTTFQNCGKFLKRWEHQTTWSASWETCMKVKKQQSEPDMEQWTGSKLGKEYIRAVYCHLLI